MRTIPQSFVGGEVSREMFGRVDDARAQHSAELLLNMVVRLTGTAQARPGTEFQRETRNHDKRSRLVAFRVSGSQAVQIEIGLRQEYPGAGVVFPGYIRFHPGDATLLSPSSPDPYIPNQAFLDAAVNVGANTITIGAGHGLTTGLPIRFTKDSPPDLALPVPLQIGIRYYAIRDSATVFRAAATFADALAGNAIDITSATSGGTHRVQVDYVQGDIVSHAGAKWYCWGDPTINGLPQVVPGGDEAHWYQLPATGEYEVPHLMDLTEDQLFAVTHSQQGDTMTFAHGATPASELVRVAADRWTWNQVTFAPSVSPPTDVQGSATKRGGTLGIASLAAPNQINTISDHGLVSGLDYVYIEGSTDAALNGKFWGVDRVSNFVFRPVNPETGAVQTVVASGTAAGTVRPTRLNSQNSDTYVVTAVSADGRESTASGQATVTNNLFVTGSENTITWVASAGAERYRVYKRENTLFGIIGETEGLSFVDDGIAPEMDRQPPILDTTLGVSAETAPRAVCHFEGRCCFGGPDSDPQAVWMTRSNTERDLSFHIPVHADDRISQRIKARTACTIRHLVPLGQLVALTDSTEFRITPINTDALTPDSFAARPQGDVGAAEVQPELIGGLGIFVGAAGGRVYQIGWRDEVAGYVPSDLCARAGHLVDGDAVVQMTRLRAPWTMLFFAMASGRMLGLTLDAQEQVLAWHQHTTDGAFESVSAAPDGDEDRLSMIVRRTIGGVTKRYVERLRPLGPTTFADSWFVDSALAYAGAPATTLAGFGHLEGKTLQVFADSAVRTPAAVASGQIVLEAAASQAVAGLAYDKRIHTRPAAFAVEAFGEGRTKSVERVWVRVEDSAAFQIGSVLGQLDDASVPEGETEPFSGLVPVLVPAGWGLTGQLFVEQPQPLPLTVVSYTAEMAIGGD